jgi:proteasome lid subunit RPN8/RPN11
LRDRGETEVGGFGICSDDDLLRIDDVQLVQQTCTLVTVEFDDQSVADFFDRQVDAGLRPEQFARIWIHTHPGGSARPSQTDEETFARVFGDSDWALMFILAQEGESYARLQFNVGPGSSQELNVEIDYSQPFASALWEAWEQEYVANVQPQYLFEPRWSERNLEAPVEAPEAWRDAWHGYTDEEFQEMFGQ